MWDNYASQLRKNREQFAYLRPAYDAFTVASERAALLDEIQGPTDLQSSQLLPPRSKGGSSEGIAALSAKDDLIAAQETRLKQLERDLLSVTNELSAIKQKARIVAEEDQLRTKHVEALQEEVIALTLQTTLAEETRQNELSKIKSKLGSLLANRDLPEAQVEITALLAAVEEESRWTPAPLRVTQDEFARLESQLSEATEQLHIKEQRIKNMQEEGQLRAKVIQDLNDEILSLTMQLNLSNS